LLVYMGPSTRAIRTFVPTGAIANGKYRAHLLYLEGGLVGPNRLYNPTSAIECCCLLVCAVDRPGRFAQMVLVVRSG